MTTYLEAGNVTVGTANGVGLYVAPYGTAAPADCDAAWPEGWVGVGYIAEDNPPKIGSSTDKTDLGAWQTFVPLKSLITKRSLTIEFTLIEITAANLALYFDTTAATITDGEFSMSLPSTGGGVEKAVGLDIVDGDIAHRVILSRCTLSAAGDLEFDKGTVVGLPVTLGALDNGGTFGTWLAKNDAWQIES